MAVFLKGSAQRTTIRLALLCTLMVLASVSHASAHGSAAGASTATPLVIGETFTLDSKVLGETRRITVYRPSAWNVPAGQPLPVLYMPDGGIGEDFLHVAGLIQVLVGNGGMRPFLLVGIENTERRRDMTGPTDVPEDRKIAPRVGGSAAFRQFLRTELMPLVRRRYATTGESAIIGESLAGLFVVETLLREPDLFDSYIALDPSLWWNRGQLADGGVTLLTEHATQGKQLFMASSNQPDIARASARFSAQLSRNVSGVRVQYVPMPAETHQTLYHPAALQALRALFPPPTPTP